MIPPCMSPRCDSGSARCFGKAGWVREEVNSGLRLQVIKSRRTLADIVEKAPIGAALRNQAEELIDELRDRYTIAFVTHSRRPVFRITPFSRAWAG